MKFYDNYDDFKELLHSFSLGLKLGEDIRSAWSENKPFYWYLYVHHRYGIERVLELNTINGHMYFESSHVWLELGYRSYFIKSEESLLHWLVHVLRPIILHNIVKL